MLSFHIPYKVEVVGNIPQLENKISKIMKPVLDRAFRVSAPRIEFKLKTIVKEAILHCPEYISLTSGQLKGELGLVDARSALDSIFQVWLDSIEVKPVSVISVKGGTAIAGGLTIQGIRSTKVDVISLDSATYTSENGESVPWLKWLLLAGDAVLLSDHHVSFNLSKTEFTYSRTGLAIMRDGGTYRIPPQFSGVKEDNFVTRALESISDTISDLIITEVQDAIN